MQKKQVILLSCGAFFEALLFVFSFSASNYLKIHEYADGSAAAASVLAGISFGVTAMLLYCVYANRKKAALFPIIFLLGTGFFYGARICVETLLQTEPNDFTAIANAQEALLYSVYAVMVFFLFLRLTKKPLRILNSLLAIFLSVLSLLYSVRGNSLLLKTDWYLDKISGSGVSSAVGFTEGHPQTQKEASSSFDRDQLLIGAYGIKTWDIKLVQLAKEANLDFLVGTGYRLSEEFLNKSAEENIGIIASWYSMPYCVSKYFDDEIREDWLTIPGTDRYKDHSALWGDFLFDEPHAVQFGDLTEPVSNYYKKLPGKIPLVNLFGSYSQETDYEDQSYYKILMKSFYQDPENMDEGSIRYRAYISDYLNKVPTDYICYDVYPMLEREVNGSMQKRTSETWLRNMDVVAEACRNTGRDFWIFMQACGNVENRRRYCNTPSDISQQVYAAMAFGVKSVIFSSFQSAFWDEASHMLLEDGTPTETYSAVKTVTNQLLPIKKLYGEYTYSSTYFENAEKTVGYKYPYLRSSAAEDKIEIQTENGLLIGVFHGENGKRAYVVTNIEELNRDTTATATLTAPDAAALTVYQNGSEQKISGNSAELTLSPGEGVFITADPK